MRHITGIDMKKLPPIGQAIAYYESIQFISVYRMSQLTGVSQSGLSRIKNGKTNPSLDTLDRIAKVLQIKTSELIAKSEEFEE